MVRVDEVDAEDRIAVLLDLQRARRPPVGAVARAEDDTVHAEAAAAGTAHPGVRGIDGG